MTPSPEEPETARCAWARGANGLLQRYHDLEWGVPHHGERALFELLTLEGAQAGLSWTTILTRREGYRRAFAHFDAEVVASWGPREVDALVIDVGIVRHRAKIESVLTNARAILELRRGSTDLDEVLWRFVDGLPLQPRHRDAVPATTPLANAMSRDLKGRGFVFLGPTICYALAQAAGLTNDHTTDCFRHAPLDSPNLQ